MPERTAYLRDQAVQLQRHADNMDDAGTKEQLHNLAIEYIERARKLEASNAASEVAPQETLAVNKPPEVLP